MLCINIIFRSCCKSFCFFLLLIEIEPYWIPVTSYGVEKEPDINTPSAFSYSYELVTVFVIPESYANVNSNTPLSPGAISKNVAFLL